MKGKGDFAKSLSRILMGSVREGILEGRFILLVFATSYLRKPFILLKTPSDRCGARHDSGDAWGEFPMLSND
jgi:hypothetical protein